LIEHLEANKGSKTFTFLVTMQNHGGYMDLYDNFPVTRYVNNVFTGETNQVNTYIELAKKSDEALKDLIEYLKAQPEKYVLVVFGDHQPSINAFTNNMSYGNNTSWQIPYIIWSNYDMDTDLMETMKNDVPASSLNYLGLTALKAANIKLPAYYQLIDRLRTEVPSINSAGYYSIEDNKYHFIDDLPSPLDKQHISDYDYLRYALMFDQKSGNFENKLYNVINSNK
ncbi:MAG: sulfatase-like hydrolase/transferase, partial [Clostridiales bacterium]|nr:sulfatase-like hydrolase/transferase [Clostridiales bacterium]